MRLTWLSNAPWATTGYGCQTRHVTKRLIEAGHPTAVIANYGHQGAPLAIGPLRIYGPAYNPFCVDIADAHSTNFGADVMFSFYDLWPFLGSHFTTRWVQWIPVDHDPIPPNVLEVAKLAYYRISCSKFGQEQIIAKGLDCDYAPCCVDTDVFRPTEMTDEERKSAHIPRDKFVVGMVAMNKGDPPRKAFYQNIAAFAELHRKHPDTVLYLHTNAGHPGNGEQIDLVEYCISQGLKDTDVIFPDAYQYLLGYGDGFMAKLYTAMDVHLLVSMGEGFGIPLIEAQACGTPVITGDWTSMSELCFSGWKVDKKDTVPMWGALGSNMFLPNSHAIAEKLELAYQSRGNTEMRKIARGGAMKYSADKVFEKYWKPILKRIEDKIADELVSEYQMNGEA